MKNFHVMQSRKTIKMFIEKASKFSNNVTKKLIFKCIIVGEYDVIDYDEENDIYIVPFNALGIHEGE